MTDHQHHDQDKPVDIDNAADHRPASASAPAWRTESREDKGAAQNPNAKLPPAAQLQKQQRSQGMNHSGWEGKG
ncbi:MAG: hypothetical protein HGA51_04310 [Demequinaceae bacterium]|nr:hypothetical protein [Demequinaceae bacterium]